MTYIIVGSFFSSVIELKFNWDEKTYIYTSFGVEHCSFE
jgi:hypothetical protein